ncbi:MAG: hypothetical protein V4525_16020 [Pseudomonadota bacterium]
MKIFCTLLAFALTLANTNVLASDATPLETTRFKTVSDALVVLQSRSDVSYKAARPGGMVMANYSAPFSTWSFVPKEHYAYPAVVKREVKQRDSGEMYIEVSALCQAEKLRCEKLMDEFELEQQ